jgi:hypothetical protein
MVGTGAIGGAGAVRRVVDPLALELDHPAVPRPGDEVVWFEGHAPYNGHLLGHRADGRPCVLSTFGMPMFPLSYDAVRVADAKVRLGPNWERMPETALVVEPTQAEAAAFRALLEQRTPPGPKYRQLVEEIRARGYEIFLVGGTVRDVLAGTPSNDVDLVTTMPLDFAFPLVQSMYGQPRELKRGARVHGHLRLGGAPGTADPFIDLSLFKDVHVGSDSAIFNDSFVADVGNRDFACNAVYYDPVAEVLLDPAGVGIRDAEARALRLICDLARRTPYQLGQIAVRFFKFRARGFEPVDGCTTRIVSDFLPMLAAMDELRRIGYLRGQLLGKAQPSDHATILEAVRGEFVSIGAVAVWEKFVAPFEAELLA